MRVVELERDTKSVPYQVIRAAGYVAGVFSLVVCILMIANNVSVKRLDPVHSPALTNLVAQLKSNPRDQAIIDEIRELDYLTRKAFFTSQHFNRTAIFMLVGGLAVSVISFKTLRAYQPAPPYPDSHDPKNDPASDALWARKSVTTVGLVLVGFALVLALPWRSPLDKTPPESTTAQPMVSETLPAPSTTTATASAPIFPTIEEREMQWPGFLGAASGHSRGGRIPVEWDAAEGSGVRWESDVPLPGMNSPVVWENRVFLSGANASTRELYCYDALSGDLLWKRALEQRTNGAQGPLKVSEDTGHAASTMATDGTHAFAIFADGDLAAFDFDGTPRWQISLGLPVNAYGYSSSLASFEDLVIVQFDRKQDSFIAGIEATTGMIRWKTEREFGPSWASPLIIHTAEGAQVITAADPNVVSYDPRTGEELWSVECLEGAEVAVSPSFADGVVYVAAEYLSLTAIDVATHQILWQSHDVIPGISTPLVVNGLMFFGLTDSGIVCLDAETGELLWEALTDDSIYSSPVLVGDHVYLVDLGGVVHIFKADGGSFQSLGSPNIGEQVFTTPAIAGDGLFIRGVNHLFRLGS